MSNSQPPSRTDGWCPDCKGSGTVKGMTTGRGPDDYEMDVECPKCGGTGAGIAPPSSDKRDSQLPEVLEEFVTDMAREYGPEAGEAARGSALGAWNGYVKGMLADRAVPSATQQAYPDAEADGVVFCGKCGARR